MPQPRALRAPLLVPPLSPPVRKDGIFSYGTLEGAEPHSEGEGEHVAHAHQQRRRTQHGTECTAASAQPLRSPGSQRWGCRFCQLQHAAIEAWCQVPALRLLVQTCLQLATTQELLPQLPSTLSPSFAERHSCGRKEARWPRLPAALGACLLCALCALALLATVGAPHRQHSSRPPRQQMSITLHASPGRLLLPKTFQAGEASGWGLSEDNKLLAQTRLDELEVSQPPPTALQDYLEQQASSARGLLQLLWQCQLLNIDPSSTDTGCFPSSNSADRHPGWAQWQALTVFLPQEAGTRSGPASHSVHGRDIRLLWNASFAAAPSNWRVGDPKAVCAAIAPANATTLAIVGNGPLSEAQRAQIAGLDRVVRFNAMNNR